MVEPKLVRAARRQAEFNRLRLCRRHCVPPPEVNVRIEAFTVDFLWRRQNLIVEVDGYGAHSGRQAFRDDRVRDARLTVSGYRVQRFSDWQLEHEPDAVAETVRSLL